jgi:hypothetical protein
VAINDIDVEDPVRRASEVISFLEDRLESELLDISNVSRDLFLAIARILSERSK